MLVVRALRTGVHGRRLCPTALNLSSSFRHRSSPSWSPTLPSGAPIIHTRPIHNYHVRHAQHQEPPIQAAQVGCAVVPSKTEPKIVIQWEDGRSSTFDNQFLFDHCRCSACFHGKTRQRLRTLANVPSNVSVASAQISNGKLHVVWQTTPVHESSFPLAFLRQASYDPPLATRGELLDQSPLHTWGSEIAQNPPTVTYESVIPAKTGGEAEKGVLSWLDKVHEYGFCFVTGVPTTTEATEELIRRMGHIRETHYGGFWDFTADMSKGDLAYSNQGLPAHTDTAYFTDPAGLQIFHCLHHPIPPGTGGETLLVDAFFVAEQLSENYPEAFATLSRLAVPFHASGNEGTLLRPPISQPVFRHDHLGRLYQARWNNEDRCVLGEGWTPDEVRQWYTAARLFEQVATSKEAEYWVKLTPGTVVVIDNWRVMHGRAAFTGQRRMCGAYVGADDWKSRRRSLTNQFKAGPEDSWSMGW